jgi:hypothetical protein
LVLNGLAIGLGLPTVPVGSIVFNAECNTQTTAIPEEFLTSGAEAPRHPTVIDRPL